MSPSGSCVGLRVITLIAPPVVLRPYSVPCGPRSTSRRSMSKNCAICASGEPMYTPSVYKPTALAVFGLKSLRPTPRMKIFGLAALSSVFTCRLGASWFRSVTSLT